MSILEELKKKLSDDSKIGKHEEILEVSSAMKDRILDSAVGAGTWCKACWGSCVSN